MIKFKYLKEKFIFFVYSKIWNCVFWVGIIIFEYRIIFKLSLILYKMIIEKVIKNKMK